MSSSSCTASRLLPVMFTLMFLLNPSLSSAINFSPKREFHIENALEDRSDLTLHCRSKEEDLGVQVLKIGQEFQHSFHLRVFPPTPVYNCEVHWPSDPNGHAFPVFDVQHSLDCDDEDDYCLWLVKRDGPCNKRGDEQTCYQWARQRTDYQF